MGIVQIANTSWFLAIVLLSLVRASYQTAYSCNTTASCGCSTNPVSIARIVGGEDATAGTWGWAVSISIDGTTLCGGSIISSSWVITAAHCVDGYTASQITVYAGSTRQWYGTQTRVASQIIAHSGYNSNTYVNDIALLKLASPLIMSDPYVSSICLPSVSSATLAAGEWPPVGTTVIAVGWGQLNETGSLTSTLQQVTVQTVPYNADTCAAAMVDWQVQFCAGVYGGGRDTCQGDSGGPLMMFTSSNQWVLVGLTSSGIGCARATDSGLYTRVAAFQDWIDSNTNYSINTLTSSIPIITSTTVRTVVSSITSAIIISPANRVQTSTFMIMIFLFCWLIA